MKICLLFFLARLAAGQTAPVDEFKISGVVVDHLSNRALNRALVQLVKADKNAGEVTVFTGPDGLFRFTHVPKGRYRLLAAKRGEALQGFQAYDGYSTAIVVDGIQKTDALVFPIRTPASINATVLDENGDPVRNARIEVFDKSVVRGEVETRIRAGGFNTNSSGQIHVGHLEPGRYYLAVEATPWFSGMASGMSAETDLVYPVTFYVDTTDANSAHAIPLAEGSSASIQITLHTTPGIRVKLPPGERAQLGIYVAGPGDTRIPLSVSMAGSGQAGHNGEPMTMELMNLPAGRYEVTNRGEFGSRGQIVDLENGSTLPPENNGCATIRGKLLLDGLPPKGGVILALNPGLNATIAPDGTFKFDSAAPGKYSLSMRDSTLLISAVEAQGARLVNDSLDVPADAAVELTIKAVATETLASLEGIAMQGNVAVGGAMVLLLPRDAAN